MHTGMGVEENFMESLSWSVLDYQIPLIFDLHFCLDFLLFGFTQLLARVKENKCSKAVVVSRSGGGEEYEVALLGESK